MSQAKGVVSYRARRHFGCEHTLPVRPVVGQEEQGDKAQTVSIVLLISRANMVRNHYAPASLPMGNYEHGELIPCDAVVFVIVVIDSRCSLKPSSSYNTFQR